MVRRKYAKLYCWLRLSYANPSSQHCPFWHWTEPAYRSYHRGQRNRNQDQHASSLGLCRSHSPSAAGISYRVDLILDKQANGAVPLGADIYDTLVAGVSPENRFMNLLNSDRFSLVKRWEGDINPPSFIVPDATGSTLIVGRDLRLKKKCSIRVELTLMPPLPSLMLSPTTCCWSSLHPIKTLVVHSELKSSTPPTLASVSRMRNCDILDYYRK